MNLPNVYNKDDFVVRDLEGSSSQAYRLLKAIVVPRPVAFITTKGDNGIVNAAPFSYFNAVCAKPTIISVSIERRNGRRKDTSRNIFSTKEFVINICSCDMAKAVELASHEYPPDVSEISLANLSLIPSQKISTPRVANTLIQMECTFLQSLEIGDGPVDLILAKVVTIHLHKDILDSNGRVDIAKLNPLARLSGKMYARLADFFEVI